MSGAMSTPGQLQEVILSPEFPLGLSEALPEAGLELHSTPSLILQPPPLPRVTSLTPYTAGAPAGACPSLSLRPGAPSIISDRLGKLGASHHCSAPTIHSNVPKEART